MSRRAPVVPRRRSLMDAEEVGAILKVPASWVLTEARADRIPHLRLGRYVRFEEELLEAWCKRATSWSWQRPWFRCSHHPASAPGALTGRGASTRARSSRARAVDPCPREEGG